MIASSPSAPSTTPTCSGDRRDCDLIERSWDEPEMFAAVFDRHAPVIHRYVARRLGPSLADDVTGETFLVAFRQRRRYDVSRTDARPWLYGIASNLIRRHQRAELRQYRALTRTGVDPVCSTSVDADRVDEKVTAQAVSRPLAAGLAGLAARDRHVVLLFAWAELSYDEIAVALGIPVGTVRSRLNRARRKLREALGGTDPRRTTEERPSDD